MANAAQNANITAAGTVVNITTGNGGAATVKLAADFDALASREVVAFFPTAAGGWQAQPARISIARITGFKRL